MKKTSAAQRMATAYNKLSAREQKLLVAMAGIMAFLIMIVVVGLFQRSLSDLEEESERHRQTLGMLAIAGPVYLERQSQASGDSKLERFTDEVLYNNDLKLTSFVATHAAATNINVNSYNEEQRALGSSSKNDPGPIVTERNLTIDIRDADMARLISFLDRIEKSPEPVVIKRIDVRELRGTENIRATVVVSTYERREKES